MYPTLIVVAALPFGRLPGEAAAQTIEEGLLAASYNGPIARWPLGKGDPLAGGRRLALAQARALVLCDPLLGRVANEERPTFALAQRARQAGVPAWGVTATPSPDRFLARLLDLQLLLYARGKAGLRRAGELLGEPLAAPTPP